MRCEQCGCWLDHDDHYDGLCASCHESQCEDDAIRLDMEYGTFNNVLVVPVDDE